MRGSQLLLDNYWVEELCFSLDEKYKYEGKDPVLSPKDLNVIVEPSRNPDNPLQWLFRLAVRLDDKVGQFPYRFTIRLTGFFEVKPGGAPDSAERLALVNAPSILYASARELLAMTTGRSRFLSIILPSITFYEPELEKREIEVPKGTGKRITGKSETKPKSGKKGAKGGVKKTA